jgi:NitT/TauT family transport system substrate-binding protein
VTRRSIAALVLGLLVLASCAKEEVVPPPDMTGRFAPPRAAMRKVTVRLTWLHQASYVPFHVAKEKRFYAKHGLDVEILPSGPDLRPIGPVAAGSEEFGVEGAAAIIQAAANNVPVVVIGTYLHRSPEVFMARKSDHLDKVSSWRGKRVGLWIGTHVEPLLYAMLQRQGMSKSDVDIIPAKFDIAPFLTEGRSRVPIWNAYIYNEAQIPGEKGIPVDIITPESVGVYRVGEGVFTSARFAAANPEVVKAFLAATREGIEYAAANQEEAIKILTSGKYGTGFDLEHQRKMLAASAPLMRAADGSILTNDKRLWAETVKTSFPDGEPKPIDIGRLLQAPGK